MTVLRNRSKTWKHRLRVLTKRMTVLRNRLKLWRIRSEFWWKEGDGILKTNQWVGGKGVTVWQNRLTILKNKMHIFFNASLWSCLCCYKQPPPLFRQLHSVCWVSHSAEVKGYLHNDPWLSSARACPTAFTLTYNLGQAWIRPLTSSLPDVNLQMHSTRRSSLVIFMSISMQQTLRSNFNSSFP